MKKKQEVIIQAGQVLLNKRNYGVTKDELDYNRSLVLLEGWVVSQGKKPVDFYAHALDVIEQYGSIDKVEPAIKEVNYEKVVPEIKEVDPNSFFDDEEIDPDIEEDNMKEDNIEENKKTILDKNNIKVKKRHN